MKYLIKHFIVHNFKPFNTAQFINTYCNLLNLSITKTKCLYDLDVLKPKICHSGIGFHDWLHLHSLFILSENKINNCMTKKIKTLVINNTLPLLKQRNYGEERT